jgi:excisionase family DNA binding protein
MAPRASFFLFGRLKNMTSNEAPLSLLSEAEAADRLGIDKSTLCRLRQRQAIGYFRVGGRILFSEEHITAFLEAVEHKPAARLAA